MSNWQSYLKADPIPLLLEPENPSVRYFTLTEIIDRSPDDPDVLNAQKDIMLTGEVPTLMEGQTDEGYWDSENSYYLPRYTGTAWRFLLLAEFNADGSQPKIRKIANYLYQHAQVDTGGFSSRDISIRESNVDTTPCFTGNMVWSCIRLGYLEDPQVQKGIDWIVKYSRFDDGNATTWPEWLPQNPDDYCWGRHTCFRGVIAHLQALAEIPVEKRSLQVKQTLEAGVEYILIHHVYKHSHDLSKPITKYMQVGFPLYAENDMLRMLLFLTKLDIRDNRMQEAIDLLVKKQNMCGQWKQQHIFPKTKHTGFIPISIDPKGQSSKWVTLRALITLKRFYS